MVFDIMKGTHSKERQGAGGEGVEGEHLVIYRLILRITRKGLRHTRPDYISMDGAHHGFRRDTCRLLLIVGEFEALYCSQAKMELYSRPLAKASSKLKVQRPGPHWKPAPERRKSPLFLIEQLVS